MVKRNIFQKIFNFILIVLILGLSYLILTSKNLFETNKVEYKLVDISTSTKQSVHFYDQIGDGAKIMYSTILSNLDLLKKGTGEIKFPNEEIIKETDFQTAWDAFILDRPEVFYIDTSKVALVTTKNSFLGITKTSYSLASTAKDVNGNIIPYYNSDFKTEAEVDNAILKIEQIRSNIINVAKTKKTLYEQIKYVHDYLVKNVSYDELDKKYNNTLYAALVGKSCVCQGYSLAFKYILDGMNIPCIIANGIGINSSNKEESHSWNYVQMEDGQWYAVDVTWDDPIFIGSGKIPENVQYKYFLKGSKFFFKNHKEDGDVSKTGQNFKYLTISENDYI